MSDPLSVIALIVVAGIGAQWVAWRLRLPSILLLLLAGIALGPLSIMLGGAERPLLDVERLLGDGLLPIVSLSVGLILYEGGLTLELREVAGSRRAVFSLVTVGAAVTWVLSAALGMIVLGLPLEIAALLGAILVVTGPTVVGPLLRHVRPKGKVGAVLKWEGIVIDPIGATLAVLVFEAVAVGMASGHASHAAMEVGKSLLLTIVVGGGLGWLAAVALSELIRRYWIPDSLQNPVSLMLVIAAFTLSNLVQHESGLLATTVMGVVLANQRRARIHHIVEFKENLRVLLISMLFIVLGANLRVEDLRSIGFEELVFVVLLILLVRPASVFAATSGDVLTRNERLFLSWMAPRGIVAAAVASLFALRFSELEGFAQADVARRLVPVTFTVIIGTVLVYGTTASWVARRLDVADQDPQGVLLIGAHKWAREIARVLAQRGFSVLLVDSNRLNLREARMMGLRVAHANVLEEGIADELDLTGIGRVLALTPNDEVNALALQQFVGRFERAELYRLAMADGDSEVSAHEGRPLFAKGLTYAQIASRFGAGHVLKATRLSEEFTWKDYRVLYGSAAIPMFIITPEKRLIVVTADKPPSPSPGSTVIALVDPDALFMGGPALSADEDGQSAA